MTNNEIQMSESSTKIVISNLILGHHQLTKLRANVRVKNKVIERSEI